MRALPEWSAWAALTFNNGDKMRAKKYIDMAIKINRFFFDGDQKCLRP